MKHRTFFITVLILLCLACIGWWLWPLVTGSRKQSVKNVSSATQSFRTGAAASSASSKSAESTKLDELQNNPKVKAIQAEMDRMNAGSQDFYGKIIDQYGNPVAGATATGVLMQTEGIDSGTKKDFLTTESDNKGYFEFTNLHGWRLGIVVKKDGYQMGQGAGFYEPANSQNKSSSEQRAVFHMWKMHGAAQLTHRKFDSRVPYEGSESAFNIIEGDKSPDGQLRITLSRDPINVHRGGAPFDWRVQIGIANGGLMEASDLYPNEAPETGYQNSWQFSVEKDSPQWTQRVARTFYIHNGDGTFGRMNIDLTTDSERPQGTGISIEVWVNPSPGDRNLEYDPSTAKLPRK